MHQVGSGLFEVLTSTSILFSAALSPCLAAADRRSVGLARWGALFMICAGASAVGLGGTTSQHRPSPKWHVYRTWDGRASVLLSTIVSQRALRFCMANQPSVCVCTVYTHVCTHVYTRVCTHVCTHVYTRPPLRWPCLLRRPRSAFPSAVGLGRVKKARIARKKSSNCN